MAETLPRHDARPRDRIGRFLFIWCKVSAAVGIALLFGICFVSVYSVVGRWLFSEPVLGDVELVQIGCVLAVASFLPYCQMKNSHVIVDFFTHGASPATRALMDRIAALLLAIVSALIAWQSFVGTYDAYRSGEEQMILGWPLWWAYINVGPAFVLLALAALYTFWKGTPQAQEHGS